MTRQVLLHALAHARTGDKGNRSSISLVAYEAAHWETLVAQVTFPHQAFSIMRAFIASADQGHAHSASGPYGFHAAAAQYDA